MDAMYRPPFFLQGADSGGRRKNRKRSAGPSYFRSKEASEKMKEEGLGAPTSFETETALAWLYFYEKQCDIVVLETGMGGTLDATNLVKTTVLEILTPVSMDHMDFLGDTLEKIAAQKAGIIKPGTSVVSAAQIRKRPR